MLNSSRLQRLTTVLESLTQAIYPNVRAYAQKGPGMVYDHDMMVPGRSPVLSDAFPGDGLTLDPVSGKVVFHFTDAEDQPVQVVTMSLTDGQWVMEVSDPPKKPGRKPRQKPVTAPSGTVQGAKGPVDPERQERAKKAAQTRAENRKRKEAEEAAAADADDATE